MKISTAIQRKLELVVGHNVLLASIVREIDKVGGHSVLVGGAVRDLFLGLEPKDIDIEVHGLKIDQLQKILKKFGNVSLVGKSFGVLRINGLDVDWSLPRKDSKGRKPKVVIDSEMSVEDAFRRRDLTINAIGIDLVTKELVDPFGGLKDLNEKRLRVTDKKLFIEDPLRFFRVMQFIGRFEMEPDEELNKICKKMDLSGISRERIEEEFNKLFLKSKRPSLGIDWIRKVGRLKELLPEVYDLIGIEQDAKWHPEGEVYGHTLQVLDAAAAISTGVVFRAETKKEREKLMLLWAALCHDLGKPGTSKKWGKGKISAYGHEKAGVPLTKKLLKRFTRDKDLIEGVCKLVEYHMQPGQFVENGAKPPAYKRLAKKLAPQITLELLAQISIADKLGRNPKGLEPLACKDGFDIDKAKKYCKNEFAFVEKARQLKVLTQVEAPVLHGRDLMGIVEPGPKMGYLLKKAYEIQIEEGVKDKKELKKRILS